MSLLLILDDRVSIKMSLDQHWGVAGTSLSQVTQQWELQAPTFSKESLSQEWVIIVPAILTQSLNNCWELIAGPIPSVLLKQVTYSCKLTGSPDLMLPMSGFDGRFKSGEPSYLSVRVPDGKRFVDGIAARASGEIVITREGVRIDGTVKTDEIARVNLETARSDQGARNSTVTIVGHKQITNTSPKRIELEGVTYRGEYGGKRHFKCRFDQDLTPGDTAVLGVEEITVGAISYQVGTSITNMEITEA